MEIAEILNGLGRDVVILASSDMTHYEPEERTRSKDHSAVEAILSLDEDALLERIADLARTGKLEEISDLRAVLLAVERRAAAD